MLTYLANVENPRAGYLPNVIIPDGEPDVSGGGLVKISEVILGSASATITFSSISSSYTHLRLVGVARSSDTADAQDVLMALNSDTTAANYTMATAYGGSGPGGGAGGNRVITSITGANAVGTAANSGSSFQIDFPFYRATTFNKGFMGVTYMRRNSGAWVYNTCGDWVNTSAITQIDLTQSTGGNFITGSRFSLYGIS